MQTTRAHPRPLLEFMDKDLPATVRALCSRDALLVTDAYNHPKIGGLCRSIAVEDTDGESIDKVVAKGGYNRVIAVGGCTALDFGRACAKGMWMAAVPTILSNCCLSSARSVIRRNGSYHSEPTSAPSVTVVSRPTIEENHADREKNWSASGFGDLFSTFAAVAEACWDGANSKDSEAMFRQFAPICADAFGWIGTVSYPLGRHELEQLAGFLHEFSIVGHESIPVGSEHALYYALRQQRDYPRMVATHGRLVSIGTLMTLRAWSESMDDFSFYDSIRAVFGKLGLPLTLADLKRIGVEPEHIMSACGVDACRFYGRLLGNGKSSILTRVFARPNAGQ